MTTFNLKVPKDTPDVTGHAGDVIEAATGTRHDTKKYGGEWDEDPADNEVRRVAVDFAPDIKETHRSGTRGTMRGTRRGGF